MSQELRAYEEFREAQHEFEGHTEQHGEADDAGQPVDDFDVMCEDLDVFCETHLDLASPAALQRKRQMQRRLTFVQDLWNDADRFDAVVASGRYLKLCNLTEWISAYDERAWERVKNEILAGRQREAAA